MLTADLVEATRRKGELHIRKLDAKRAARASELAAIYLELVAHHRGRTRDELAEATAAVEVRANERRLAKGLLKLIEDRATFDEVAPHDPEALRRTVFARASRARREAPPGTGVDRSEVLAAVGAELDLAAEVVDRALFADLRGAHVLLELEPLTPDALVVEYERAQAQAVLLRAVRVVVVVECASAAAYRALFRKLKFLMLLASIHPSAGGRYRLEIDGPFSMFDSVTKYGLKLAQLLPVLEGTGRFALEAEVRWGPARQPLTFRTSGGQDAGREHASGSPEELPEDLARLVSAFAALGSPWRVSTAPEVLELPGLGVVVPDLCFEHPERGERVFLEVLGYWSRDAVWKRVELVERGLGHKILFAVGSRLRVSEAALGPEQPGALYVYKGTMSARAVLERIEALAARPPA